MEVSGGLHHGYASQFLLIFDIISKLTLTAERKAVEMNQ
jgi:hypothetical protein